ncbi:MAG: TerB family tellurite resistance protein, partial [Thiobacillus sp.]
MLTQIKRFFDRNLLPGATEEGDAEHALRLAVGALLLEVVRLDGEVRAEERDAVETAVLDHFDLSAEEAGALLKLAEDERRDATDYFQFTSLINRHYTPERKIELIERLWSIAY